ncbi:MULTISPECIES: hypothetical protein [unclassified Olsenella]|jgi:hypothetical protein|uniref:DUF7601 domain-containing protein n=1 Tax=Atopobiaceae TaxID=1643824 RepID=UPI00117D8A82|nr:MULTISPECIES: hypothetical protein [unclassified Olsenella]
MSAKAKYQVGRRPLMALAAAVLAVVLSLSCLTTVARADDTTTSGTVKIGYDSKTDIHSVTDDDGTKIILYCMNNQLHWPHSTSSTPNVPNYTLGYLTPGMFRPQEKYEECMEKLLAILYAGYPYNGLHLYEVTDQGKQITEAEFNQMLDAPEVLRRDFPDSLGDTTFTYADYTSANKVNLDKLKAFLTKVFALFPNGKSASGLTYQEILTTNFYNAASAMVYGTKDTTPLQYWNEQYADDTLVTESQAYKATRDAIWVLLQEYGVPSNNLTRKSLDVVHNPLSLRLLDGANANEVLRTEPQASALGFSGDTKFAYDPATKTWRTGLLTITEGEKYNGLYKLTLPEGMTAVDEEGNDISGTTIRAGRGFCLVSSTKPTQTATVSASSTLTWLKETRQYSPVNSTEFQHMIGALIYTKDVSTSVTTQPATEGSLSVTKNVDGEENSTTAFKFTVTLGDTSINGSYGAMDFTNGVATFELHNGEAAVAEHLPAGVTYTVAEEANDAFTTTWDGQTGSIVAEKTVAATCTNTLKPKSPEPKEPITPNTTDETNEETKPAPNVPDSKPAPKQPAAVPDTSDSTNYASIVGFAVAGVAVLSIAFIWGGRSRRRHGDHLR